MLAVPSQAQEWGTIKGKIISGAPIPPQGFIKLPDNPGANDCIKANDGLPPPNEAWVVNPKNKGLKNTFVWLADENKKPLPIHPNLQEIKIKEVEIDQPACHFIPHCLALRQGQTLLVKKHRRLPA